MRRVVLRVVVLLTFAAMARQVLAQVHLSKPLKFVMPFTAGSATDVVGRIVEQAMGDTLGQPVAVDNKAGANGILGAEADNAAPGDGCNLPVSTSTTQAANFSLTEKLPCDPVEDVTPIGKVANTGFNLMVRPEFPGRDMKELIACATANPGKLAYGHDGQGLRRQCMARPDGAGRIAARGICAASIHFPRADGQTRPA